ncbi:hypothetical protein [Gordonia sp. (in: high G+C Gram-positive bacteria)]|uniref:hypothetical protein n=1 Tax=Gordonia sp. (in: high G+C Gram-positive bacteria) TaxID=84139 RepID=UPI003C747B21
MGRTTTTRTALSAFLASTFLAAGIGLGSAEVSARPSPLPLGCVPFISTFQLVPPLPGLFTPLPSIKGPSEFDGLPPAPRQEKLPAKVEFRDNTQGFNSRTEAVLHDGHLYARARHSSKPWRKVATPGCLDGEIVAISVNNNMLVALDKNGFIYSLDNLLSGPMLWNWTRMFGGPIWLWPGMQVPNKAAKQPVANKWSISHRISTSFKDPKGVTHPTTAGLVELVSLADDGSRIIYQDPWLPADFSYEIGGPEQGRFQANAISTSGSVTLVQNKYGDMFTRLYDLDTAGANHIPGRYSWQPQPKKPSAPNQLAERFNPGYAAIDLPGEDWKPQPKIPGTVTSRISIHDSGATAEDRELRVEGMSGGTTGYWHKPITASTWAFTPTGQPLRGQVLHGDPSTNQTALTLAPKNKVNFRGKLPDGWTMTTENFEWAQTKHPVTLTSPTGRTFNVELYTTDGLRLLPRGPGLDNNPRTLEGAIDFRSAAPWRPENAELNRLIRKQFNGAHVYETNIQATKNSLTFDRPGVVLVRK